MDKILIAGPSGSGKSTVAWELAQRLNYSWFCLDGYFKKPIYVTYNGKDYKSYEHPGCYNSALMLEQILKFEGEESKYVNGIVIEGFCVFNYPAIFNLTKFRFFLDATHEICVNRRIQRTQGKSPADESYMIIGEGEALKHVYPQKAMAGVVVIDANLDINTIINKIQLYVQHSTAV